MVGGLAREASRLLANGGTGGKGPVIPTMALTFSRRVGPRYVRLRRPLGEASVEVTVAAGQNDSRIFFVFEPIVSAADQQRQHQAMRAIQSPMP